MRRLQVRHLNNSVSPKIFVRQPGDFLLEKIRT